MEPDPDWEAVKALSEEELDAELREAGIDPDQCAPLIAARLVVNVPHLRHGVIGRLAMRWTGWTNTEGAS